MRKFKTHLFIILSTTMAALSLLFVFTIFYAIAANGISAISFSFLTQPASSFGESGGILFQILGTLILVFGAGILSLPIALGAAIYHTEFLRHTFKRMANILMYVLNAVPTILFGLLGYLIFGVYFKLGVSWLSGCLILAIMILPTIIVSIREAIESIPRHYRESGIAMGFTKWHVIKAIIIPQSFYGVITGILLGLARAAGETAAIMFTATTYSGIRIPESVFEPVTSLQTHILVLSQEALNPVTRTNAWGAALVLVVIVFIMNLGSVLVRRKLTLEYER